MKCLEPRRRGACVRGWSDVAKVAKLEQKKVRSDGRADTCTVLYAILMELYTLPFRCRTITEIHDENFVLSLICTDQMAPTHRSARHRPDPRPAGGSVLGAVRSGSLHDTALRTALFMRSSISDDL